MSKANIRRFVTYCRKGADRLSGDLELAGIDLEAMRRHFGLKAGDPMYEVFPLTEASVRFLRLKARHEFEFDKNDYFLECSSVK